MKLTVNSRIVTNALNIVVNNFGVTRADVLGRCRKQRIILARQSLFLGFLNSGHFTMTDVASCFCIDRSAIKNGLAKLSAALKRPTDDLDRLFCEVTELVRQFIITNHRSLEPFSIYRHFEQVLMPVLRPECTAVELEKIAFSCIPLKEGYLASTEKVRIDQYAEPLHSLLKAHNWESLYVWIKPRLI
jgi:hypothetical protein